MIWGLLVLGLIAFFSAPSLRWSYRATFAFSLGILLDGVLFLIHPGLLTPRVTYLAVSPLRAWFLLILGIVSSMVSWYRVGYHDHHRSGRYWLPLFLLSMLLVILSNNVWVFMTVWEGMTITSFFLVLTHHQKPAVLSSGYIYLIMSQLSAMLILGGMLLVASHLGTMNFSLWARDARHLSPGVKDAAGALLGLGFAMKSGVVPFHIWLPRAHPVAPAPVSSLMSGVMIKLGIFGILQFLLIDFGPSAKWWPLVILAVGAFTSLLGILYALMEKDLKRLLAYSSIENVGIILLGIGVMAAGIDWHDPLLTVLGLAAALFHSLNHAVVKSQLFLAAGAVEQHTDTLDANQLGGLIRTLPGIGLGFIAGSMAMSALPPFNGFVSEFLTLRGLLALASHLSGAYAVYGLGLAAILGLTGALAAVAFVKATGVIFLGEPRQPVSSHPIPRSMTAAILGLGGIALLLGVAPEILLHGVTLITVPGLVSADPLRQFLLAPRVGFLALLVIGGTGVLAIVSRAWAIPSGARWASGRVADASMQFTATSFTKAIRTTFAVIYRPHRELVREGPHAPQFPDHLTYRGGTRPIWERYIYRPLYQSVWRISHASTKLQAGPVRLYLAYLLGTVGLMLALLH